MNCVLKSFNGVRAEIFDYKLSMIGKAILRRSRPHIHNEFQFSGRYSRVSISATLADNANSVRFKFIEYSHEAERWDTNIIPMTDQQEDRAWVIACIMADLPTNWLDHEINDKYCYRHRISDTDTDYIYKGPNAVPYDKIGQLCHISPLNIWHPSKDKTWCTKTTNNVLCAGRPDFKLFVQQHLNINELKPDQLDYMARYYFSIKGGSGKS